MIKRKKHRLLTWTYENIPYLLQGYEQQIEYGFKYKAIGNVSFPFQQQEWRNVQDIRPFQNDTAVWDWGEDERDFLLSWFPL